MIQKTNRNHLILGDKERRGIDQQNRDLKLKLLANIDEVEENLRNVKTTLAGKIDDVQSKSEQIEASNLETHTKLREAFKKLFYFS